MNCKDIFGSLTTETVIVIMMTEVGENEMIAGNAFS